MPKGFEICTRFWAAAKQLDAQHNYTTTTHVAIRAEYWNNQQISPGVMLHELHRGREDKVIK